MTKLNTLAGTFAAAVLAIGLSSAVMTPAAEAATCSLAKPCAHLKKKISMSNGSIDHRPVHVAPRKAKRVHHVVAVKSQRATKAKRSGKRYRVAHSGGGVPAGRGNVVAMIKSAAPRYGVPTWFALRIAQVESGYNPRARGAAGELGVYQLKCATARGLGFRGDCSGLLNASTNIQFGLKHLSAAVRSSRGNLKLAASKHNGGLGRKSLVPRYVAQVF
jgi:soluble lytic murein transglycosylase-like protein